MLNKQACWTTAAEPVAGESQLTSVSERRGDRVYSKLDYSLPVPATVTGDPLSLRSLSSPLYLPSLPHSTLLLTSLHPFLSFSLPCVLSSHGSVKCLSL
jgi:hypothetical protein